MRNQAKRECRKAQKEFEKKLAKESKKDQKTIHKYAQSELKTRTDIADLAQEDCSHTTTDKQKADELNKFFCIHKRRYKQHAGYILKSYI